MATLSETPDGGALRRRLPWPRRGATAAPARGEDAKRVQFHAPLYPYLLLLPQMAIVVIFFYLPSYQAVLSSFYLEDPFGFGATFVGLENYQTVLSSSEYLRTARFTVVFSALVTFFSLAIALLLAVKADAVIRGQATYKTLLM